MSFNPEINAHESNTKNHETKAEKSTKTNKSLDITTKPSGGFEAFANLKEQLESKQMAQNKNTKSKEE